MGGIGSGTWCRIGTKCAIEECIGISVRDIPALGYQQASGTLTWQSRKGGETSLGYVASGTSDRPTIWLRYQWRDRENVLIPIRLQSTPTNFNGRRWWFTCPLAVDGVKCNQRVGTLYLPTGARYFGCRDCHGLTYRSCQEAHQEERLAAELGVDRDTLRLLATRLRRGIPERNILGAQG